MVMPSSSKVTFDAEVRPTKRSLIVVFAYKDSAHFDYLHLSTDTADDQPMHNGVFHVYGGERVRISSTAGRAAFAATRRWYHVKLQWDGLTGEIHFFF